MLNHVLYVTLIDSFGKLANFMCDSLCVSDDNKIYINSISPDGSSIRLSFDSSIKLYSVHPHTMIMEEE